MLRRLVPSLSAFVLVVACSSPSDDTPARARFTPLPRLASAPTTVDRMLSPTASKQKYTDGPNPADPDALASYLTRGFGDLAPAAGEPHASRAIDGSTPPPAGPRAKRLVRFAHLADLQLADDESPSRLARFDSAGATSSAARPQDMYLCRMANAAVRTINALHVKDPIAFTLMGGDNADDAQTNEVDWVLGILSGASELECDSGSDDDPVAGPDNDGKDPFAAEGLSMPWKWVTGNHDILVQGNLPVDAERRATTVGNYAAAGTRDYLTGGKIETGEFVVADPKRALLNGVELMAKLAAHGDGHGIGAPQKASGRATYTFDVADTPLRVLVIDTAHENGGSEGVIRQSHFDAEIKPALDEAKAKGKWVILASHHATSSLGDGTGLGGTKVADALTPTQWETLLAGYPNVIISMVGHSHRHRVNIIGTEAGHRYWEVMTSAIADWPHQFRVVEIFDQDNGWLMMRATCVDLAVEGDRVAEDGRRAGVVDLMSGWLPKDAAAVADRNVELWIKKPL
ncbi:MAG: metallophosphoesterase [Deltaproteobacteria bacterium]|nr:metallophosphoesterase [Deltaproteobacteria bacterium]